MANPRRRLPSFDDGAGGRAAKALGERDRERATETFGERDRGRAAETFGDSAIAEPVTVLVPGSDTGLDTCRGPRAGAPALRRELGGRAAAGLGHVANVVLYGAAGTGASGPPRTSAPLRAARGSRDRIGGVPHVRLRPPFRTMGRSMGRTPGLGLDPVLPALGVRVFAAGGAGRGDHLRPGTFRPRNLAAIVSGAAPHA